LFVSYICRASRINLQLLEADTIELDAIVDDEEARDERLEVEVVPVIIELVDDDVGVGEIVVSSSVGMIEVRVELVRTVDWAEACATYIISVININMYIRSLTVLDSSPPPSRGSRTPADDLCLATNSCRR
jgi:hypothetical protein